MILDGASAGLRGHAAAIDEGERLTGTTKTTEYDHHQRNAYERKRKRFAKCDETVCVRLLLFSLIVRTSSQKQLVRFEGLEGLSASWGGR